jgi:hypothetical protein
MAGGTKYTTNRTQHINKLSLLNWVIPSSMNYQLWPIVYLNKRTQNVGDLSLPKGEASVLHNIKNAKQTQLSAFSA